MLTSCFHSIINADREKNITVAVNYHLVSTSLKCLVFITMPLADACLSARVLAPEALVGGTVLAPVTIQEKNRQQPLEPRLWRPPMRWQWQRGVPKGGTINRHLRGLRS